MREGNGRFNQRRVARKEKMRKDRRRGAGWWKQETDILQDPVRSNAERITIQVGKMINRIFSEILGQKCHKKMASLDGADLFSLFLVCSCGNKCRRVFGQVNNPSCQKCRLSARNKSNIYFCQTNTHLGFGGKSWDGVFSAGQMYSCGRGPLEGTQPKSFQPAA